MPIIGFPGTPGGTPPTFPTGGGSPGGGFGSVFTNPQNLILLGTSILGSLLNRPRGLSREQRALQDSQTRALQQLIATLSIRANAPISIDPRERALLYGNIAETTAGAQRRGEQGFASRGLSRSGLLADYSNKVNLEAQRGQNAADVFLLNKASGERQNDLNRLISAIGLQPQPGAQGQSAGGAVLSGLAPILAYIIRTQQLASQAGGSGGTGNQFASLLPLLLSGTIGGSGLA